MSGNIPFWGAPVPSSNVNTVPADRYFFKNDVRFPTGKIGVFYRGVGGSLDSSTATDLVVAQGAVLATGTLPPGLTLKNETLAGGSAELSGTPTAAGKYTFEIRIFQKTGLKTSTAVFDLVISDVTPPSLTVSNSSIPNATVGVATTFTPVTATLSNPGSFATAIVYSLADRGSLPVAATMNSSTGLISATFLIAGSVAFKVRASAASVNQQRDVTCSMNVMAAAATPQMTVTANTMPNAIIGIAYSANPVSVLFTDMGANDPTLAFSIVQRGSLPASATLHPVLGVLTFTATGSPTTVTFKMRLRCNSINQQRDVDVLINVVAASNPSPPSPVVPPNPESPPADQFVVNWSELPNVVQNVSYTHQVGIGTKGPSSPVGVFSISDRGNLPSGVVITSAGVLAGTLNAIGSYAFTINALYLGKSSSKNYTLNCVSSSAATPADPTIPPTPPVPPPVIATYESDVKTEWYLIHQASDDGNGKLGPVQDDAGTVNYDSGEIHFPPEMLFENKRWSDARAGTGEWVNEQNSDVFASGGKVSVSYRPALVGSFEVSETLPAQPLEFSLTPYSSDSVVPGTVRFTLGSTVYEDNEGVILHTVNPSTGSGTIAGSINYDTGDVTLTDWVAGAATFSLQSLATMRGRFTETEFYFRTEVAPIKTGQFQLATTSADGELLAAAADNSGDLIGDEVEGTINVEMGLGQIRYGKRVLETTLTAEERLEEWYDVADMDEDGYIWKPRPVIPTTARYNAVYYTTSPVDSSLIGIDTARLPSDGRVQVVQPGDTAILHHTGTYTMPNPLTAAQVVNLPRGGLSQVILLDTAGTQVSTTKYTVNLNSGAITMANPLDLAAYLQPLTAHHTIREMARISDVEISGQIQLARSLTKTIPVGGYLSTLLAAGDRFARVFNVRMIQTWTNFTTDGAAGLSEYDDVNYPLVVTNEGTIEEDWAVVFENATTVKIIGDRLGQIATGVSITGIISPLSKITNLPYFSIAVAGWGTGYVYGNALRFKTFGASFPHWHLRCVQPHDWDGSGDVYEWQSIGEVDP